MLPRLCPWLITFRAGCSNSGATRFAFNLYFFSLTSLSWGKNRSVIHLRVSVKWQLWALKTVLVGLRFGDCETVYLHHWVSIGIDSGFYSALSHVCEFFPHKQWSICVLDVVDCRSWMQIMVQGTPEICWKKKRAQRLWFAPSCQHCINWLISWKHLRRWVYFTGFIAS